MHAQLLPLAATKSSSGLGSLIFPLLIVVLLVLFITSQRRKQRAAQQNQAAIEPGAEVVTTAGLYATVRSTEGDTVLLEVAPGVVSRYARGAITRVIPPETDESDDDDGYFDDSEVEEADDVEESGGEVDLKKGPAAGDGTGDKPPA